MVKRGLYLLVGILVVYVALVASHKGEFFPFSIYPMFSRGAHPWTSALVRDINPNTIDFTWQSQSKKELPGVTFALNKIDANQNDLSAYLKAFEPGDSLWKQGLKDYFKKALDTHNLLVYEVHGQIIEGAHDSVVVAYKPFVLLQGDTLIVNPHISR